jgi:hypothetical protein
VQRAAQGRELVGEDDAPLPLVSVKFVALAENDFIFVFKEWLTKEEKRFEEGEGVSVHMVSSHGVACQRVHPPAHTGAGIHSTRYRPGRV